MIELDEKDHIICLWLATDINDDEFMMLLRRRDDTWLLDYRFRYVIDDQIWDSSDKKSFFHAECPTKDKSKEEILSACHGICEFIGIQYPLRQVCQRIDGNVDKFIETTKKYECFHMREVQ